MSAAASPAPTTAPAWTALPPERTPAPGVLRAVRLEGHYLLVGRRGDGQPFALDGRCPHEGYPLVQGSLEGCTLTCTWHNWKFDTTNGSCTLGGEDVRAWPVREVDGRLEVDLSEPAPEQRWPALRASLERGLFDRDVGRALRDAARLLVSGYDAWRLLADVARYDATHAEFGSTHVLAVATDAGRMLPPGGGPAALHAIAPVLELCAETDGYLPEQSLQAPLPGADEHVLRAAVEAEDRQRAVGLLRGAFAAGIPRATIEGWLLSLAADHFTDFGHPLIYLVKAIELLDHCDEHAEEIYSGWLTGLVLATHEDTLPYWRAYAARTAALAPELAALAAAARPLPGGGIGRQERGEQASRRNDGERDEHVRRAALGGAALRDAAPVQPALGAALRDSAPAPEGAALRDAVLDGSAEQALDALERCLRAGLPATEIARWLVAAAAHRLLRFDVAIDADPERSEGWLWATHRFTYASAVRVATTRLSGPPALRLLLHSLAFTHSGAPLDRRPPERLPLVAGATDALSLPEIARAIAARDTRAAVAAVAEWLASGRDVAPLRALVLELGQGEGLVRPIVVAHAIKTTSAAWEEHDALAGHPDRAVPVLAAVALLASPIVERRLRSRVDEALAFVVGGRIPRKLTQ